jgi:predicted 3-demethylubiquinone-9 3-methyltransferase (glyoxalase superfamily)
VQPQLVPNIWFDTESQEAAEFYCSVFPNSRILDVKHYNEAGPREAGLVLTVEYELNGLRFVNINGGPEFKPNEAISFLVECDSQDEIDFYWDKLVEGGGEHGPCGWLKDRYGVSWQVAPRDISDLVDDPQVMAAMLKMGKIDVDALRSVAA